MKENGAREALVGAACFLAIGANRRVLLLAFVVSLAARRDQNCSIQPDRNYTPTWGVETSKGNETKRKREGERKEDGR